MYYFAKLCRLCLTSVNTAVTLTSADGYNVTLFYKLMTLFPDLVSPNDDLPMHICSECFRKLNISYQFQVQCIEAHKKLKNYLFQLQNTSSNISHSLNEANVNIKTEVADPNDLENFTATDTNTNTLKHLFIRSQKRESCDYETDNDLHSEISSNFQSTVKVEIDNEETIAAQNIDQSNELERGNSDISEPVRREVSLENPNLNLNQEKSDNISEVEDTTTSHITSETRTNLHHETRFSFCKEFQESKPDINIFSCTIKVEIDDEETVAAQNGKNNERNALESAGTDISGSVTREHRLGNPNFDSDTEENDYSSNDDQSFYPAEDGSSDEDYDSDEDFKGRRRISSSELTNENIPHLSNAVTEADPSERETENLMYNNSRSNHMAKNPIENSIASNNSTTIDVLDSNAESSTKLECAVMVFDNEGYKCVRVQGSLNEYMIENPKHPENNTSFIWDEEENVYICKKCDKTHDSFPNLKSHLFVHMCEYSFSCDTCGRKYKSKKYLARHKKGAHNDKEADRYKCDKCNKSFNLANSWEKHVEKHDESNRKFQCGKCGKKFFDRRGLRVHEGKHTGEKPYKCPNCDYKTRTKQVLDRHVLTHMSESPFLCDTCGKKFKTRRYLAKHKMHTHKDKGADRYKCDKCNKSYRRASSLKLHVVTHDERNRKFQCGNCDMKFFSRGMLRVHERQHTGEKSHKCEYCDKSYRELKGLQSHVRTHTGEKPFKCDVCGKCFTETTVLKVHQRIHTGERPYKCADCGKTFVQSYTHSQHVKKKKCQTKKMQMTHESLHMANYTASANIPCT